MRDQESFETDQPAELSDELNQFARRLYGFQPSSSSLDREQLMFEAGRAAALAEINRTVATPDGTRMTRSASMRVLRFWQTAALLMAAVSLSFATSAVLRGNPEPRLIVVERNAPVSQLTVAASDVQLVRKQPNLAEKTTAVKIAVSAGGANSTVANSTSVDAWSSTIAQRPSSQVQQAIEFALANGLSQRDNSGRANVESDEPNRSGTPNEPALSPLSLRGDSSGLLIHRLVEEYAL
jgi:hypothetical protein